MLTHDQINAKLEDDHSKRMVEINQLEGLVDGILNNFVVYPTRATAILGESIVYINYRLHQLVDWSLNFEVETKGLFSLKWKEVHDRME